MSRVSPSDRRATAKIAVVGCGPSGIAAAAVWKRCGYTVTVFEKSAVPGGQWNHSYPRVTLQNTRDQYQFAEFPWPFKVARHPTGEEIVRYMKAAVDHFDLAPRYNHELTEMAEAEGGRWALRFNDGEAQIFDYVVLAIGQYPGDDKAVPFETDAFQGKVVTRIDSTDDFRGKKVAVVGNGKTALDMATLAVEASAESVVQVIRKPRWAIPDYLLGISYDIPFFSRFGSDMMPAPSQASTLNQMLHKNASGFVRSFWYGLIANLFGFQHRSDAKLGKSPDGSTAAKARLAKAMPPNDQFIADLRSASALAPQRYMEYVAHGKIDVVVGEATGLAKEGVIVPAADTQVPAEFVFLGCGNSPPEAKFLPNPAHRELFGRKGGIVLYRHLVTPDLPNVGFAGFNHGFIHMALAHIGSLWEVAAFEGMLHLPSPDEQRASAERVAKYKADTTTFESTINMAVNTRYQQHLDILCLDLGIPMYRKWPILETFARYNPTDYKSAISQYLKRCSQGKPSKARIDLDC